ncbi:hypothetical protein [Buttiauxella sp. A111]|uniref:hypothetical protein n=1 Tax=Buttiauxella sp. A111 TaxID=2563088 RepID=UPI0010D6B5A6|nr:hypothetical protein [Buttiauxella sp. A111]GDX06272.1 hypothetical protein BSPA111_24810 [Buttiauxella sp. A111]
MCPNAGIGEDTGLLVCESLPPSPATVSLVPIPATVSLPSKSIVVWAVVDSWPVVVDELFELELMLEVDVN